MTTLETQSSKMNEDILEALYRFACKHKGNTQAAEVLMSFCRGECQHLHNERKQCDLCGAYIT